ncbi:cytosine permease [Oxyplasma meridianum]|uniref:Cytosine permease n=1 Tax=Oxyplasma meridianum TaxID=3073602 RepID=A0AAX4NFF5_9ARCH
MSEQVFVKSNIHDSEENLSNPLSDNHRDLSSKSMFTIWFASNLTIGDFAVGFIPIYLGLGIEVSIAALVIGSLMGGVLLGLMSSTGPRSGLPQMVSSKFAFGLRGSKVMSSLQWVNTAGWLSVNLILAAFALSALFHGLYFVLSLVIVALVVALAVSMGHKGIHTFERILSIILGILFLFIIYTSLRHLPALGSYSASYSVTAAVGFGIVLASSFSYIMSWGPYASDYSRFVPSTFSSRSVFSWTLAGSFIASVWAEIAGLMVAVISGNPNGNPATDLASIMGKFGYIGLISLFLGGLSANALNLYSNSISLRSTGIKINRKIIIGLVTLFSVALGIIGYNNFYAFYETFLFILDYWITPWIGVMVAEFFIVRRISGSSSITPGFKKIGFISYLLSIVISIPFMNPGVIFIGPVSSLMGGVDTSYYVSFLLAIVLYVLLSRYYNDSKPVPKNLGKAGA